MNVLKASRLRLPLLIAAVALNACGGSDKTTDDDTDTTVDTANTGSTGTDFFDAQSFSYTIQMGVDANGKVSTFSDVDNDYQTGVFVTLTDRRGDECQLGFLLPEGAAFAPIGIGVDTDTDTDTDTDIVDTEIVDTEVEVVDQDLLDWLGERDQIVGFRLKNGEYDKVDADCELDPAQFGDDAHEFFMVGANGDSLLVGVGDALTEAYQTNLEAQTNLDPAIDFWTSGRLRVPFTLTVTDPDTGSQTQTDVTDTVGLVYEVTAGMEIIEDAYVERGDLDVGRVAAQGVYIQFSGSIGLQ